MDLEKINQVWFMQTTNRKSYLIITKHEGSWERFSDAIKYDDSLYGINTSDSSEVTQTTLVNLIERVCEYDKLSFINQRWERPDSNLGKGIDPLTSYTIQFLEEDIDSKDICCLIEVYNRSKRNNSSSFCSIKFALVLKRIIYPHLCNYIYTT